MLHLYACFLVSGISFEFTIPEGDNYNELLVCKDLDENLNKSLDTEDTGNTEFLDSIGLTAREHFPKIQEQQRLNDRAKMRLLDNRMESTVRTTDCNSLFNFLLNSNFLCAPSGTMAGIPPTLISPSPFEGGSLSLCRAACGPLQHQHGTKTQAVRKDLLNGFFSREFLKYWSLMMTIFSFLC